MSVRPFHIHVEDAVLDDLRQRLDRTRWPDAVRDAGWDYGTEPETLRRWCERWARDFDWRAQEARLNAFDQFVFPVDGVDLHFVHVKGEGDHATPLLLMNGWPSTFAELTRVIAPLTRPSGGGPAFDVVIPSLPGYGFSGKPGERGWGISRIARAVGALMTELGYERFGAHGSDMGAGVVLGLAMQAPERLIAMHSVNVYWAYPPPKDASEEERAWLARGQQWAQEEGAYAAVQGTKPQTLAPGLNDSPAGLAAWVLEKWQAWSDGGLDAHDPDDVLTNLTIYWATGTIGSSTRLYYEAVRDEWMRKLARTEVPAGVLILRAELTPAPRAWGERWLNVKRWTEGAPGGHFPALENADLLVGELRALFEAP